MKTDSSFNLHTLISQKAWENKLNNTNLKGKNSNEPTEILNSPRKLLLDSTHYAKHHLQAVLINWWAGYGQIQTVNQIKQSSRPIKLINVILWGQDLAILLGT